MRVLLAGTGCKQGSNRDPRLELRRRPPKKETRALNSKPVCTAVRPFGNSGGKRADEFESRVKTQGRAIAPQTQTISESTSSAGNLPGPKSFGESGL